MAVALLALFVALGPSAYATHLVVRGNDVVDESLSGADIRGKPPTSTTPAVNGSLTGWDIGDGTVTSNDLRVPSVFSSHVFDNSLTGTDINESSLGKVPNADRLDGRDSVAFDETTFRSSSGGPVDSTDPGVEVPIPLTNASFTQKAGEAVLIMAQAELTASAETSFCGAEVIVYDARPEPELPDVGLFMWRHANKGDPGTLTEAELLAAPAVDTPRTLRAFVVEHDMDELEAESCDGADEDGIVREDTWTARVDVTIAILRP